MTGASFEARYSIPKLLGWTLLAAPLAFASAWMTWQGVAGGSLFAAVIGSLGLLFFGGAIIGYLACMVDRRAQLRISREGLFLRPHSDQPIQLRSIRYARIDSGMVKLLLYKPSKYPIQKRLRRLIYRINGSQARPFFGDAWIWTWHYDCSKEQVFAALNAQLDGGRA